MLFLTLALVAILTISCTEDFTDPKVLSGTIWRCTSISSDTSNFFVRNKIDYYEIKFTSTSTLENWFKYNDENPVKSSLNYTYLISGKIITINFTGGTNTGIIENKTMKLKDNSGKVEFIYVKQ